MAIVGTTLTSGQSAVATGNSLVTTASITPTANSLILITVADAVNQARPTVTGNGITYSFVTGSETALRRHRVWRGLSASPTASVITIDYGAGTPNSVVWSVDEFSGVSTAGTNGSSAISQGTRNSGVLTDATVSLITFSNANNGTFGGFASDDAGTATPGGGFTELTDHNLATPAHTVATEWKASNDTSVDLTFTGNGWRSVGIELVADVVAATPGGGNYYEYYWKHVVGD